MSSSRKIDLLRNFAAGFIGLRPRTPSPPPPTHCVRDSILIHTGNGGRVEPERREKVRGATVHKAGSKIPA
jgi:hypothetical protein